jgi:aspartate/methionine/tyrosine aminotransferase
MNSNVDKMTPFIVMDVLERANELQSRGIDIIHLEVGEPDFDMPQCAVRGAQRALTEGLTHYTHSLGLPELRQAIASQYKREYDVEISPEQIALTCGSSQAILMAIMLLAAHGDEVIMSDPGYACYSNFALACGATPVLVKLKAETGFQFDIKLVKKAITPKTKAIIINSPMTPTGTILGSDVLRQLASLGIPIISDEIYHGLVYTDKADTILQHTAEAYVVNGFSKRYAMTGLRLGYLIAPMEQMRKIQTMQQNLFICAPSVAQYAALEAITNGHEDVESMRRTYDERRKYLIGRLHEIGFVIHTEPQGAFYILADAKRFTNDSYRFAFDVLEKAHVGITPGIDFGDNGEGFVRFSYANSLDNIRTAMDRLQEYLAKA